MSKQLRLGGVDNLDPVEVCQVVKIRFASLEDTNRAMVNDAGFAILENENTIGPVINPARANPRLDNVV
jgi:hypothetical protein